MRRKVALILTLLPALAWGHSGGTDDLGCHHDRQEGGYHCHSGPLDGRQFASERKARAALGQDQPGQPSQQGTGYDRELYGDWIDADGDCQDTRTEVLVRQADGPITWEGDRRCEIESGTWHGPYTGRTFRDPSNLHIDHLVPLAEAHESGAAAWPAKRKRAFANSPKNLIVVEAGANMSKGAEGPTEWLPPAQGYHCEYVERWVEVKEKWGLTMGPAERNAVRRLSEACPGGS